MTKIRVRPGQNVMEAFEEAGREKRAAILNDAAIACAKTVEAARLDERERCIKVVRTFNSDTRGTNLSYEAIDAIIVAINNED